MLLKLSTVRFILIGFVAGLTSGLLGVGGGIAMVPLMVWLCRLDQKTAHATSLAAIIPIASVGAAVFAVDSSLDLRTGAWLAAGSFLGAPLGAWALSAWRVDRIKVAFGVFQVLVGLFLVLS